MRRVANLQSAIVNLQSLIIFHRLSPPLAIHHLSPLLSHPEFQIRHDFLAMVRQAVGERYDVDRELGRGGASLVYSATDAEGRRVALKVLRPELSISVTAQRFLREIGLLADLEHPRIARLLDYGEREYLVYYVMSFVEGPTLRQFLDKGLPAVLREVIRGSCEVLDAVAYAHENGIVHRDVKPENIVLSPQGAVLLDFGIARAIARAGTDRLTRSGITLGTSTYMSPEQASGADDIDHRSDLYSLGCVLFECLAGRPPFVHRNEPIVMRLHQNEPPPDVRTFVPNLPAPLAEFVARALVKDRTKRWQSAREMRDVLEALSPV